MTEINLFDLLSIRKLNSNDKERFRNALLEHFGVDMEIEEIEDAFKNKGLDFNRVAIERQVNIYSFPMDSFYYVTDDVLVDIRGARFSDNDGIEEVLLKGLSYMVNFCDDYFRHKNEDTVRLFNFIPKNYCIGIYCVLHSLQKLHGADVNSVGRDLYCRVDFGANYMWADVVREVFRDTKNDIFEEIGNIERVTIYRGIGKKSASIYDAYSWTLDKNVAGFFASRFGNGGKIYSVTVLVDYILGYVKGAESEVLFDINDYIDVEETLNIEEIPDGVRYGLE